MGRKTNQAGIDIIKFYEGLRLTAYLDLGGLLTIGYGHRCYNDYRAGDIITESEAQSLLQTDLGNFESGVNSLLTGQPISNNAFSALVSFSYNFGVGGLKTSTLLSLVNKNNLQAAANEFPKWIHVNGKEEPGLIARRRAERDLFLKADS